MLDGMEIGRELGLKIPFNKKDLDLSSDVHKK